MRFAGTACPLRHVLRRIGISPGAVSIQAAGLDPSYVSGGVDYGPVRRPFPVAKALDDAILAWGMNGRPLLRDHGYPLRLVLPGWVGIASIKWLGSLEVSTSELTSPWNTKWYRMTGGDYPADSPPLTVNPVRSAWELPWRRLLPAGALGPAHRPLWSGAGAVRRGRRQHRRRRDVAACPRRTAARHAPAGRSGHRRWQRPPAGAHGSWPAPPTSAGRSQPLVTPYNDNGYFFDAVVRHPVTLA